MRHCACRNSAGYAGAKLGTIPVFQKLYPVRGEPPVEEIRRILAEARRTQDTHVVTLGAPPFERNWLNRITALRLRFRPLAETPPTQRLN